MALDDVRAISSIAGDAARISAGYTNDLLAQQADRAESLYQRALHAGVVTNREEFAALDRAAGLVSTFDAIDALTRTSPVTLDNLGLHIRAPIIPHPEPNPEVLRQLCEMYGEPPWPTGSPSAAYRTAVAMERRRQGWTRAGAEAEWRAQALRAIEGGVR